MLHTCQTMSKEQNSMHKWSLSRALNNIAAIGKPAFPIFQWSSFLFFLFSWLVGEMEKVSIALWCDVIGQFSQLERCTVKRPHRLHSVMEFLIFWRQDDILLIHSNAIWLQFLRNTSVSHAIHFWLRMGNRIYIKWCHHFCVICIEIGIELKSRSHISTISTQCMYAPITHATTVGWQWLVYLNECRSFSSRCSIRVSHVMCHSRRLSIALEVYLCPHTSVCRYLRGHLQTLHAPNQTSNETDSPHKRILSIPHTSKPSTSMLLHSIVIWIRIRP